jgi:hypothetical protein
MTLADMRSAGATRLSVLNALPRQHQDYFFEEIRKLCAGYIASLGLPLAQRESESLELLSEVMAKLLGASSAAGEAEGDSALPGNNPEWRADNDPKADGRVAWLVSEVGGRHALSHRHEDMRRRLYGRWRDGGYRTEQLDEPHVAELSVEADDPHDDEDNRRAWRGLLIAAKKEFKAADDVATLLDVLANDTEVQASFGSEWPVRKIVETVNRGSPTRAWNDERVDNAKKRLRTWIGRIRREYQIEPGDLMNVFAGIARRQESAGTGASGRTSK